jgi:5-methylcytosine-specific restriction protein A
MPFSDVTKAQALRRAGYKCESCGTGVTDATSHAHHVRPESQGGSDLLSNCQILCIACHQATPSYGRH